MARDANGTAAVISAWSAISPWGPDAAALAAGLASGRATAVPLDRDTWDVPFEQACLATFDTRAALGRKGTRSMDRATGLAVASIGQLLRPAGDGGDRLRGVDENTALTLGTTTGSVQSMMDFTHTALTASRPYLVDPARFPNTVMNCAAGQCAIWYGLKGPNTTLAGGRATGLLALQHAIRLQRAGRAVTSLCGAVEEFSPWRAWLAWHSDRADGVTSTRLLGEGAVVWLVESRSRAMAHGRTPLAEVLALTFGFARDRSAVSTALASCVRRALATAGAGPERITVVADSRSAADDEHETAAIGDVLGARSRARRVSCVDHIGDTGAVTTAFQVAAVLALAARHEHAPGDLALVTSAEPAGTVGAALLQLPPL